MPPTSPPTGADSSRIILQEYFDVILRRDGIVWLRRNDVVYPAVSAVHQAYSGSLRRHDDGRARVLGAYLREDGKAKLA